MVSTPVLEAESPRFDSQKEPYAVVGAPLVAAGWSRSSPAEFLLHSHKLEKLRTNSQLKKIKSTTIILTFPGLELK